MYRGAEPTGDNYSIKHFARAGSCSGGSARRIKAAESANHLDAPLAHTHAPKNSHTRGVYFRLQLSVFAFVWQIDLFASFSPYSATVQAAKAILLLLLGKTISRDQRVKIRGRNYNQCVYVCVCECAKKEEKGVNAHTHTHTKN